MASKSSFISATVNDVQAILDHIEQAQAIAAARAQEWVALQGQSFMVLEESDFAGMNFTLAQFSDVQTALNQLMPTILGNWAGVFYRVKE